MRPKKLRSNKACLLHAAMVLGSLALLSSCGPVAGIAHIVRARIDYDMAVTAGADKNAIYEQIAAREYLQKAKEEYGYSDFIAADEYAIKADEFAKKAREKADAITQLPPTQPIK